MDELILESTKQSLAETSLLLAEERANKHLYKKAYELALEEIKQLKQQLTDLEVPNVPNSEQTTDL